MRRLAIINQKGGVGKTTTAANLGAALAEAGHSVIGVDIDPQANLSLHLGIEIESGDPSTYSVLHGDHTIAQALKETGHANLRVLPSHIDLSGAELELAGAIGREFLMRDALEQFEKSELEAGRTLPDFLVFDCPPSLGLLAINALAAAREVVVTVQTQFMALQGMGKLLEVLEMMQKRINPDLKLLGILPCMYDSRLKLSREVLGEIRRFFGDRVYADPIRTNIKLAEAPGFGQSIFAYAPESNGADDYRSLAVAVAARTAEAASDQPSETTAEPEIEAGTKPPVEATTEIATETATEATVEPPAETATETPAEPEVELRDEVLDPQRSPAQSQPSPTPRPDVGPVHSPLPTGPMDEPSATLSGGPGHAPQPVGDGPGWSAGWGSPGGPP